MKTLLIVAAALVSVALIVIGIMADLAKEVW